MSGTAVASEPAGRPRDSDRDDRIARARGGRGREHIAPQRERYRARDDERERQGDERDDDSARVDRRAARDREHDHRERGNIAGPSQRHAEPVADRRHRAGGKRRDDEGLRGRERLWSRAGPRSDEHERQDHGAEQKRARRVRSPTTCRADKSRREKRPGRERERDQTHRVGWLETVRDREREREAHGVRRDDEHKIREPPQSEQREERRARAVRGEI